MENIDTRILRERQRTAAQSIDQRQPFDTGGTQRFIGRSLDQWKYA